VIRLKKGSFPPKRLHGCFGIELPDENRGKVPEEHVVPLERPPEGFVGRRPDYAELRLFKVRLEPVAPGAFIQEQRMKPVNEENRLYRLSVVGQHLLGEGVDEILSAAEPFGFDKSRQLDLHHACVPQIGRRISGSKKTRHPLRHRRLPHAGIAQQQRIPLLHTAQRRKHLGALSFPSYRRKQFTRQCERGQIPPFLSQGGTA